MVPSLNIAVIGAGRIGCLHAANLLHHVRGARLAAIADIRIDAAQSLGEELDISCIVDDYHSLLSDPSIDAVVIASGTDTHAAAIIAAAQAGKHIFCEKPIALSLAEIDRALAAVDHAGVKLQIGFNRRYDANHQRVKKAVVEGEIGQPHLLHIVSRDPAPPPLDYIRISGGIFLDMTIHDFDMARYLLGCEAMEIYAAGAVLVDPEIGQAGDIDTALITLKFENGALGVIENSRRAAYGYDQRVEILGSLGGVTTDNRFPNTATISTAEQVRRDLPLHFFLERYQESFIREMTDFVDAVLHDSLVHVTGLDGRMPVVMALAAQKSYAENRPVRVDEIEAKWL